MLINVTSTSIRDFFHYSGLFSWHPTLMALGVSKI